MAVKWLFPLLLLVTSACATARAQPIIRVALLAPFEGRYREVGYEALYAARLALQAAPSAGVDVELLPIDDGGTVESAADRARALAADSRVQVVVALGYAASSGEAQQALGDLPIVVAGDWGARPQNPATFILASRELAARLTVPPAVEVTEAAGLDAPLTCGQVCALAQFPLLREDLSNVTIISSGLLPDSDFEERYRASDQFTPEPRLLAALTYDAASIALEAALAGNGSRASVQRALAEMTHTGLNGSICFEDGYWLDAPLHTYEYNANRELVPQN